MEPTTPILLCSSSAYLPYLLVTVWSVLLSGSADGSYAFYILHHDVDESRQAWLKQQLSEWKNCAVTFVDVSPLPRKLGLAPPDWHGKETCFGLLSPELLPQLHRAVLLDCDLIVQRDVAELYRTPLHGNAIAAAVDPDFIGQWYGGNSEYLRYYRKEVPIANPDTYIQGGVAVLDLDELRRRFPFPFFLEKILEKKYHYDDQDFWNLYCADEIAPLDLRWNVMHDNDRYRLNYVISLAPPALLRQYLAARRDPWIIHYAGNEKPWNVPTCDLGGEYWAVAEQTPIAAELRTLSGAYRPPVRRFSLLRAAYHRGRYLLQKQQAKRRWPTENSR